MKIGAQCPNKDFMIDFLIDFLLIIFVLKVNSTVLTILCRHVQNGV